MKKVIQLGTLSLAVQALARSAATVAAPTHHIVSIDISGSMYSALGELRTHLKNKLASLVAESDTISIVWFSGRGQCGTLVEAMPITSLADLSALHKSIDRFLVPTGLTGFKEPLQEISNIVDRLKAKHKGHLFNMFFMTDGYDNQWSESEILDLCRSLEKKLDSAAVVEYGWHCNRPLMTKMAEALGGEQIFSADFQSYASSFESSLTGTTKKVPVQLQAPVKGRVFGLNGTSVLNFTPDADNIVLVPEGLSALAYLTSEKGEKFSKTDADPMPWALLSVLAQDSDANGVFTVLGAIGDVALVEGFSSCFSKEDYSRFQEAAVGCAADASLRYSAGYSAKAVPKVDAYNVLELLSDLAGSEENLFYPLHPKFTYERIGAATKARDESVTFEANDKLAGYPISGLVWADGRANVSMRVQVAGKAILPATRPAGVPATVDSFIYRSFTVIRDGIVHTRKLPVSLNEATFDKFKKNGLLRGQTWEAGKVYELTFPKLPVINRKMVTDVTAAKTFALTLKLLQCKADQKVYSDWRKRIAPKTSELFVSLYGQDATDYLATVGVTSFNGFNPAVDTVVTGDYYMASELKVAVKGASSLPKVEDVEIAYDKMKTRLKIGEFLMMPAVGRVSDFLSADVHSRAADPKALLATWLKSEADNSIKQSRLLMEQLARLKFAIMVGHVWFTDLPTMGEGSLAVELPGFGKVAVSAALKETQIKI